MEPSPAFVGTSAGFELLNVPGAATTYCEGINSVGQVSGAWRDATGNTHGFIASPVHLPAGTTVHGAYVFNLVVIPNVPVIIDPAIAVGYDYEVGKEDPRFATVRLPIGIGDSFYTLIVNGRLFKLAGGQVFDFAAHDFAGGVDKFRVAGIATRASLNPANPQAFPTELTFNGAGHFTGTMTPLCKPDSAPPSLPDGKDLVQCMN